MFHLHLLFRDHSIGLRHIRKLSFTVLSEGEKRFKLKLRCPLLFFDGNNDRGLIVGRAAGFSSRGNYDLLAVSKQADPGTLTKARRRITPLGAAPFFICGIGSGSCNEFDRLNHGGSHPWVARRCFGIWSKA